MTHHHKPVTPLTEAQLCRLWEGQRLPEGCLVTRGGQALRVLYRGRPGAGPGPDFRDAVLAVAATAPRRGDVEVHLRASSFRQHRHHLDRRYDGLVLHLVWEDDEGHDTLLLCGRRAPVVALAPWVGRRAQDVARWLSRPALWREPCHDAVQRLGPEAVGDALDALGDGRFQQRQEALGEELDSGIGAVAGADGGGRRPSAHEEAVLWRALLSALGQDEQARAFASLARGLPAGELREGAGAAPREAATRIYRSLLARLEGSPPLPAPAGRPAAHPRRRLAGAARLLARSAPEDLVSAALRWLEECDGGRRAPDVGAWMVRGPGPTGTALIGRGRALELVTNAVLPFLAALGHRWGDPGLEARALDAYRRLPEPQAYGATAFLDRSLRASDGRRRLALGVRRRQGLLALFKGYCTQGGCGRCPLS